VWAAWPQVSIILLVANDSVAALDRSLTSIDQNLTIRGQVIVVQESDDPAVCERLDGWRRRDLAILPGFNGRNRAERLEMALRVARARRVLRLGVPPRPVGAGPAAGDALSFHRGEQLSVEPAAEPHLPGRLRGH
jgi:hypothetical protein